MKMNPSLLGCVGDPTRAISYSNITQNLPVHGVNHRNSVGEDVRDENPVAAAADHDAVCACPSDDLRDHLLTSGVDKHPLSTLYTDEALTGLHRHFPKVAFTKHLLSSSQIEDHRHV